MFEIVHHSARKQERALVAGGTCETSAKSSPPQVSTKLQLRWFPELKINQRSSFFKAFILLDQQFAKDKPNYKHLLCLPMGHHCPLAHCGRMNRSLAFPHEVKQQSPLPRQSLLFFSCEKALEDHGDAYSCWRIPCQSIKRNLDLTTFN